MNIELLMFPSQVVLKFILMSKLKAWEGWRRKEGGAWSVGVICSMQCGGEAGKIIQEASSYTTLEFVKY